MVNVTLCTSGMVLAKVGTGRSSDFDSGDANAMVGSDAKIDLWISEAESYINALTRYDWVAVYSSLAADKKKILQELASSYAAMNVIAYDMAGFSSRIAAENKMVFLNNAVLRCVDILKEDKTQIFIGSD